MASRSDANIPRFRLALLDISNELDDAEVEKLKFLCGHIVPASQLEKVTEAHKLFDLLEKQNKISENDYRFLKTILGSIKRFDLIKRIMETLGPGVDIEKLSSTVNPQDLKTPNAYTNDAPPPGHPRPFGGIPKPARSLSEDQASSTIKAVYNIDGSPRDRQSLRIIKSLPSLQDESSRQLPSGFASTPKERSSLATDKTSGSASGIPSTQQGAWAIPSPQEKHIPGSQVQGRRVESLMKDLTLQDLARPDDGDLETDSPLFHKVSSASPSQSQSANTFAGRRQQAEQVRHTLPVAANERMSLLDNLIMMEAREVARAANATAPRDSVMPSAMHQVSRSQPPKRPLEQPMRPLSEGNQQIPVQGPLVDLSTDSPGSCHPAAGQVAANERVQRLDRMMDQQGSREEARVVLPDGPILRAYQIELAERPLRQFENHIICAPTGSGKTLTAAYICYEYWSWFRNKHSHKHFKALFIVNMRHLTEQQRDAFQKYFPERCAVRTIAEQQTFTDALKIDEPMPAVLMLTAQIFVNALKSKSNSVDIKDLDMIIFDECHHTDLKHPYNEIMKWYLKKKQTLPRPQYVGVSGESLPFIIGLSASLGVGGEALSHLLTLCANMDALGVVRVLMNARELQRYVNVPTQDCIKKVSHRAEDDQKFGKLLEALMMQIEDELPDVENHPLPLRGSQLYEGEAMERLRKAQESGNRTAVIVYMYLYQYNRALMLYDDLRVRDGLSHLEKFHVCRRRSGNREQVPAEEHCIRLFHTNLESMKEMSRKESEHSNEKLAELAFLLQKIFTNKPDSKGIVLVRTKVATTAIVDFIRKSTLLQTVPCRFLPLRFVGQGDIEDGCMTEAEQKMVLASFRDEEGCNILVATDIAQEGLDMPACNFVIRYNFVSNEIGTVQSKGRARAKGSECYLIVESNSMNERREMDNRRKVLQMEEAMEQLEAMTENDRLYKITETQTEILVKIRRAEEEACHQQTMYNLDKITVHCKECSALVCKASELRRKGDGGHVTCIRPDFKTWVKETRYRKLQRFRDTETIGLIKCGTADCGMQFGTIQNFLLLHPPDGYALKAQSFKVQFERGGVKTFKQWKKAGFEILKDEAV